MTNNPDEFMHKAEETFSLAIKSLNKGNRDSVGANLVIAQALREAHKAGLLEGAEIAESNKSIIVSKYTQIAGQEIANTIRKKAEELER